MKLTAKNIARMMTFFRLHRQVQLDGRFTDEAADAIAAAVEFITDGDDNLKQLCALTEHADRLNPLQHIVGVAVPGVDRRKEGKK
jgi:hypothetical protein